MIARRLASVVILGAVALGGGSAVALASGPAALAADAVDAAALALRGGVAVYSDPSAEMALSTSDLDALNTQAIATNLPLFIAVLPDSAKAGGTAEDVRDRLQEAVGMNGIYGVVVGKQFRAGTTDPGKQAGDLATQAFREEKANGLTAVLSRFIALTDERFNGNPAGPASSESGGNLLTSLVGLMFGLLCLLVVVGLPAFLIIRGVRASKRRLAEVRTAIDEDVTSFGERVAGLDTSDPGLSEESRQEVQQALDAYDRAKVAAMRMRSPQDAAKVTSALDDGRYSLACADAREHGKPMPERRPPCFVDPRHGPSVADVSWQPPGLPARDVPMCAACQTDVAAGRDPMVREVQDSGRMVPYWQAGSHYRGYGGGYYSTFGDSMSGALIGTSLGSMMWGGPSYSSAPSVTQHESSGFGSWGYESSGFGSWGSGGGGDFGGSDFGGGGDSSSDSGGGDF